MRLPHPKYPEFEYTNGKGFIAVDVDNTIFLKDEIFPNLGSMIPYAREALKQLRDKGYKIVIYSSRNNKCWNTPSMSRLALELARIALEINNIPYDIIDYGECGKWVAEFYIDDRAIEFDGDWRKVLDKINKKSLTEE